MYASGYRYVLYVLTQALGARVNSWSGTTASKPHDGWWSQHSEPSCRCQGEGEREGVHHSLHGKVLPHCCQYRHPINASPSCKAPRLTPQNLFHAADPPLFFVGRILPLQTRKIHPKSILSNRGDLVTSPIVHSFCSPSVHPPPLSITPLPRVTMRQSRVKWL